MDTNYQTDIRLKQRNGDTVVLAIDFAVMHESWLKRCLEYGARRFVNDSCNQEKGEDKIALIAAMLKEMHSGEPMAKAERKAAVSKADPVIRLARDKATTFLTVQLVAKFGKDMSVWAKEPKLAKLFSFTEKGNARFDLAAVDVWIGEYKAKRDFMQEAREELAQAQDGVDLDDLGL